MQRTTFRAMGCQVLAAIDSDHIEAAEHLALVSTWFEGWEQTLSRFRKASKLMQLNNSVVNPVQVSGVLWDVLQEALQAAHWSNGLVTPTVLPALERAGYNHSMEGIAYADWQTEMAQANKPEEERGILSAASNADWQAIRCIAQTCTVQLPAGMRLDLGGIAKGWATEQCVQHLRQYGPVLVDVGGDIAVSGCQRDGTPWPIGISDPFGLKEHLGLLLLAEGGIATSGRDYRRWQQQGIWQHHIIDPRTAQPARTDVLTATVTGSDATTAEVAAKVVLILGSQDGLDWLETHPELAGLLVLENGSTVESSRLSHYLWKG